MNRVASYSFLNELSDKKLCCLELQEEKISCQ
jgi:hypothetical protein